MNPFRSILPPVLRVMAMACVAVAMAGCASTPVAATTGAHPELRRYDEEWFDAARIGRVDILQALVAAGYPIDATTHEGYTAVILAAYRHQPEALEYLLRTGANACTGDQHGNTALMGVLFKGDTALARRLIQTHCPIDQTNNAGETALAFAALFGRVDLVPQLVAHGANLEHADELGRTALQIAVQQGNATTITALEKAGAQHVPDPAMYNHP